MSERTKLCNISAKVRKQVKARDGECCIFCGSTYNVQLCHIVPRSRGGLGIAENLVCGCFKCHMKMDQSTCREEMLVQANDYLRSIYPDLDQIDRVYKKWSVQMC